MNKIYNEITIITVLYNSSEIVESFFDSLKNFKIIVVDNGKNEKILERIKNFKNIQVISKNKNLGYGRAINFAFDNVSTNFFLVLNASSALILLLKFFLRIYVILLPSSLADNLITFPFISCNFSYKSVSSAGLSSNACIVVYSIVTSLPSNNSFATLS